MALQPASINVTWNAIYAGPHRVCFRIVGAPTYTCTTPATPHPNCSGGGLPCGYTINIMVDNETCDPVEYEGYVQPACESEGSATGRIAFPNVIFIPSPACKSYDVTCNEVAVLDVQMLTPGSGYAGVPLVNITGGGGSGATGTAVLGTGVVTSSPLTLAGAGYSEIDGTQVGIPLIGLGQVPTTGVGATVDVTFTSGAITGIVLNAPGSGYITSENPLTIDNSALAVGTPPATEGEVTIACSAFFADEVASVTLTAPGSGYSSAPAVIIDPPVSGVQATASARMDDCPPLTYYDCSGVTAFVAPKSSLGEVVTLCGQGVAPNAPDEYGVVEVGTCLCDCTNIDIENIGAGTVTVTFIECAGTEDVTQVVLNSGAGPQTFCIVTGSLTYVENGGGTYSEVINGACNAV